MGTKKPAKRVKAGTSKAEAAKRRALFVAAMIENGGNATRAYMAAGFTAKNANVAGVEAHKLLKNPKIAAAVEAGRATAVAKAAEAADLSIAGTLRELNGIVHSDVRRLFDPMTNALLPINQWPDEAASAVASIKVVEMAGGMKIVEGDGAQHVPMYTKELKFWDKNSGIDKAMKHLGLFEKDNAQKPTTVVYVAALDAKL